MRWKMRTRMYLMGVILICVCIGIVSAQELRGSSTINVPQNQGADVNVSIQHSTKLIGTAGLSLAFDPSVVGINHITVNSAQWTNMGTQFNNVAGTARVLVISSDFTGVDATNLIKIFDINATSLKNDGSQTNFTITINDVSDSFGTNVESDFVGHIFNGTFTTLDQVCPTISITSPTNGATVSQDISVTADITDKGGVNATSIAVTIDGVPATIQTITPITNGYRINAIRAGVAMGTRDIVVSARDLAGNAHSSTITVNVAFGGFTFDPYLNGVYTNSTQPFINALFVNVNAASIRMFIDHTDVTGFCTVNGIGTVGNISYTGILPDGAHTVNVNGTCSLTGNQLSANETFVKDTIKPLVVINSIKDSDGDGYLEAGELLTITYTVTDANPNLVGIGTVWNTSTPSGTLFFSPETGNVIGNLNRTVTAVDRAINTRQSTPFHIYNNYLAYNHQPAKDTLLGMEKTATYDIFTYANAITISGPPSHLTAPKIGTFQKTMMDGANVTFDNRKNNPVFNTSLPTAIDFYPTPTGNLDFSIQVPNITNATLLIVKVNNTLLNQLIQDPSRNSVDSGSLGEILTQHPFVMYGHYGDNYGYAMINATNPDNLVLLYQQGSLLFYLGDNVRTLRENAIDISSGFNTHGVGLPPIPVNGAGKGEYAIIAVCIDNDRVGIIATKPFEITEQANALSTTSAVYDMGTPVVVTSTVSGNVLSGIMVKDSPMYTGTTDLSLDRLGTSSIQNLSLYADGNTQVQKLTSNIWISKGYGNSGVATNTNTITIPTAGLLPGTYNVYMTLENGRDLTALGQTTVTLLETKSEGAASIILPNTSVTQYVFTSIPIRVANMTRGTGLSFNITYDPAILHVNNATLNQSYASAGSSLAVNSTAGLIRVALASTELITIGSPTTMFFLNVTGIGAQGSSTALNFQDAMWSNETFDIKQCNIVNGAVQISRSGGGEKQIRISSVSGVSLNSTGLVNVSIITPQSVNAFTMNFSYDPSVMNITHRLNDVPGWFLASGSAPGSYLISGFTVSSPLTTDTRLFDFQCEALRNDGKSTFINITITSIDENFVEMSNDYSTVNGTFTPAIIGAPVTNFRGTPTSGTAPLTVTFTDASANNPTGWNWNFGDGSTINATDQHPVHTYASAGIYNVSLNATNSGGSNMTTSTGYITVYASGPTLWNISMNVTSGTYNQNVIMGSAVSATRGYDVGLDIPVPPEPSGAKKIVHFSIEDAVFDHLSTDYKPPVNATNTVEFWTLYIKSNETVKVYWDARLAGNPNLTFLWNDGTTTVNMRTVTNATLPAGEYNVNLSVSTTARTDMSLKYGWNLVSVPFTSAQYVVPANAISTIYAYNPVTRGYEGPVQISSLEPGKAYWVAATRDCIINITGQPAQPIVKGLKTGWNLIGGTDSSVPFSSITIDPSGSWSLSFVYGYNVQTRMYDPVTSLQSGKGYWSAVNRDCTIIIP